MINKGSKKYKVAQRLGEIYLTLKNLSGELQGYLEDYELESIGRFLSHDIEYLEQVDHDLYRLAHKLIKEE